MPSFPGPFISSPTLLTQGDGKKKNPGNEIVFTFDLAPSSPISSSVAVSEHEADLKTDLTSFKALKQENKVYTIVFLSFYGGNLNLTNSCSILNSCVSHSHTNSITVFVLRRRVSSSFKSWNRPFAFCIAWSA